MPAVVDRMAGEIAWITFDRRLVQQMSDVVAAMYRFEQRLLPGLRSCLTAGRAGAETEALTILALDSDNRDVRAERRLDTVETIAQVRSPYTRGNLRFHY